MSIKKATHQLTKQHNRDLVLRTIFSRESISRAEAARVTHLTRTTVSEVVNGLLAEGLVVEIGRGESIGGKSPTLISIVPDSRYLIGLNLAQDKFSGALVNLRGQIREIVEIPVHDDNGEQALKLVYKILDQLIRKKLKPIVGIGVGTPGLVNTRAGLVINAVNLEWQDLPLGMLLEKKYRLPIWVLNDSQAAAIGEYVYGSEHAPDESLIVVNVVHGIGAGILINGRLFQGDGGGAGEIGHVVVQENGELCRCGQHGCLETIASARAVVRQMKMSSLEEVLSAYQTGNSKAKIVIEKAGYYLGISLSNLIGTLNIRKIVLIGDMTRFGVEWLNAVSAAMQTGAFSRLTEDTKLEIGKLDRACILGASAFLLLNDYSLLFNEEK